MAELETALASLLGAHAGLSALVSSRIYPVKLPQDPTYPAVTYARIGYDSEEVIDGTSTGLNHPRMEINSWGTKYSDALAVNAQVRAALKRVTDTSVDPDILDALLLHEMDLYEDELKEHVYRRLAEYEIWHRD